MTVKMTVLHNRAEWLREQSKRIGGSDAAAVIGLNPWMSNVDLWEYKTGRRAPEDISDKLVVKYGTDAEQYLRELFRLDFPEYRVEYRENNLWTNTDFPFAHYSADGWLHDEQGRLGILEIKTAEMVGQSSWLKWENGIPANYLAQIAHGMAVLHADFAVLKAQLKYWKDDRLFLTVRHYHFERSDLMPSIEYLMDAEEMFWEHRTTDKRPALVLPQI